MIGESICTDCMQAMKVRIIRREGAEETHLVCGVKQLDELVWDNTVMECSQFVSESRHESKS